MASIVAKHEKHRYDITVITKDSDIAYSPCGIPFVLKGDIASYKNLVMQTKEYYQQRGIDIITGTTVEEIDGWGQKIRFHDTWIDYDHLVIATGTSQRFPEIEGLKLNGVFSAHVKTLKDAEKFFDHISSSGQPLKIVITGSGSIDLEFAVALKEQGHDITVVERKGHLMPDRLDGDMGEYVPLVIA